MTNFEERRPETGTARMLRAAIEAALAPAAADGAFPTARAAAQIVGLPGLDACLAALESRSLAPRSPALEALAGRLARLAAAGSLREFRAADAQLASLAGEVAGEVGTNPPAPGAEGTHAAPREVARSGPGVATLTAAEALDELPLAGEESLRAAQRTRLTVPVAAALRATLEWLTRDADRPRPFRLRDEDSLLEVTCETVQVGGLLPAHEVLAAADGSLAPVGETTARAAAGAWAVRVPAHSARPMFLMIEQGPLRLALPWHSVLRLSLVPSIEIELRGGHLATPVLPPLAPLAEGVGERPVVAIGHGLKRALVVADRLVWRLAAERYEPDEPAPVASLTQAVRSEEGDVFWVAEPRVLLHDVALPRMPAPPASSPLAPPPAAPPAPGVSPRAPGALERTERGALVLGAEDVEPLVEPPATPRLHLPATGGPSAPHTPPPAVAPPAARTPGTPPAAMPPTATSPPATPPIAPAAPSTRAASPPADSPPEATGMPAWLDRLGSTPRVAPADERPAASGPRPTAGRAVLIAEDSIAAGHFLARMFENLGFAPHVVESVAALRAALATRRWTLVLADVELPDVPGADWLADLVRPLAEAGVPLAALVRDVEDADAAVRAGVRRWLRKPVDREELLHLLRATGRIAMESA